MIDNVWMNGSWLAAEKAHVSTLDRGFLLGDTCFETLRFNGVHIEGKTEHLALLRKSMDVLQMQGGPEDTVILNALSEAEQYLVAANTKEASVRITFSRGQGRGAHVFGEPIIVLQIGLIPSGRPYTPLKLFTSDILRNETSPLSKIKAGCYGDHLAALRGAQALGGNEALMLNTKGNIAGLAMGNIAFISENTVVTPPIEDGVRAGYLRNLFLKEAIKKGFNISEKSIQPEDVLKTDILAFGLNSLWGLRPIESIDGFNLVQSKTVFKI